MIGRVKNFLNQLMVRVQELGTDPAEEDIMLRNINEVNNLATNKIVTDTDFKKIVSSIGKTDVDDFTPDQLEELRDVLGIKEKLSTLDLKKRIKSILGDDISILQSESRTANTERDKLITDLRETFENMTKQELEDTYFMPQQKRKITNERKENGLPAMEWKPITDKKEAMINYLINDFIFKNNLESTIRIDPIPFSDDQIGKKINTLKGKLNQFISYIMTDKEREERNLTWSDITSSNADGVKRIWNEYVSNSPLADMVMVMNASKSINPKMTELRRQTEIREIELERLADQFKRAKTREKKERLFTAMVDEVNEMKKEKAQEEKAQRDKAQGDKLEDPEFRNRLLRLRREMANERETASEGNSKGKKSVREGRLERKKKYKTKR